MGEYREFGGVWLVGEWGNFWYLGKLGQVWGKYVTVWGEEREGVGTCVGSVGKYGEVCLGCGERCGKGVMVGAESVGLEKGRGGAGKCGEKCETIRGKKGGVTI